MDFRLSSFLQVLIAAALLVPLSLAQQTSQGQSSSSGNSSSAQHVRKPASGAESRLDAGSVSNRVYRNQGFGFTCKIPEAWVLRTEELNARDDDETKTDRATQAADVNKAGRVLLATFSRPPQAKAEDVNSSILIAAESAAAYPGLKEAAQYFGPITEVAEAQGFNIVNEPYEFVIGPRTVVRGDFEKNVGTRVMRQATLVVLARGYAVSFTFIGGTENEVEELVQGLSFASGAKASSH